MSWREVMSADDAAPDPIKELLRPKSLNDWWVMHIDQRIDRGEEFDEEGAHDFALSLNTKIEMK